MTASIINKTFKSIVAASAALIMAASVAACGPSAATPSDENSTGGDSSSSSNVTARSLDEIKKSGELKVAVFSDKAPFGYIDKEGKNAGYDVYFAERRNTRAPDRPSHATYHRRRIRAVCARAGVRQRIRCAYI
mgnify:CR=1 FL=1